MKPEVTLRKPNVTLVMMTKAGKLTVIARKLLNSILLSSAQQLKAYRASHCQDPPNTHLYLAPASELLEHVEVDKSNLRSALRKYVVALRRAEMDWEAPDAKSGTIWSNLSVLSQAQVEIRNGSLWVLWALPPEINKALSDSQAFPFTKLDLEKISRLKSYTAVALYEICARYKNNYSKGGDGQCLTSANPPEWWVDALTSTAPKIDKETGKPIRREWRKVKDEAVKTAMEQIHSFTDLELELKEKKVGKAVRMVQFTVRQKRPVPEQIQSSHFALITTGERLGLTQKLIESGINQWSVDQVSMGLAKFEARRNRHDLAQVDNFGGYFTSIMEDIAPVKVVADTDISQDFKPLALTADKSTEQVKGVQTLAKEKFLSIPEAEKRNFANRALGVLAAKGVLTDQIRRKADAGVWSGVLLSMMVELFSGAGDLVVAEHHC